MSTSEFTDVAILLAMLGGGPSMLVESWDTPECGKNVRFERFDMPKLLLAGFSKKRGGGFS